MVSYSFKRRFVTPYKDGIKIGTIRAPRGPRSKRIDCGRDRHAYPGDPLTLLTGPRFKPEHIGQETCAYRSLIELRFKPKPEIIFGFERRDGLIYAGGEKLPLTLFDRFSIDDGFSDFDDLARFWRDVHAALEVFSGVHICWRVPSWREGA